MWRQAQASLTVAINTSSTDHYRPVRACRHRKTNCVQAKVPTKRTKRKPRSVTKTHQISLTSHTDKISRRSKSWLCRQAQASLRLLIRSHWQVRVCRQRETQAKKNMSKNSGTIGSTRLIFWWPNSSARMCKLGGRTLRQECVNFSVQRVTTRQVGYISVQAVWVTAA